jgi:DEAD/DEAH box helicase domain-containing protein
MGLAVAGVWDSLDRAFTAYGEKEVAALVDKLRSADLVVGFNSIRFDYEVIRGYTDFDFLTLPSFDILDEVRKCIGFRLKLDHLAEHTLGSKKSADGLLAVQWYKEGRMDLIREYCEQDVAITRDLFEFGVRNGYLNYIDKKSGQKMRLRFEVSKPRRV